MSWKRRFSDGGQEAAGFAELVVASATGESTRDARTQEAVLEVELADGARVRVFARADAVLVRAAVEAVRAC
ncbi:MAG: hypothetical protein KF858_04690 [Candidatus Sumerlaeia bacterium]|nr:hypothetical protein [Candidatus Sumerlaeia bacterium]